MTWLERADLRGVTTLAVVNAFRSLGLRRSSSFASSVVAQTVWANRSALTALRSRNLSLRVVVTRFMGTIVSFLWCWTVSMIRTTAE